MRCIAPTHLSQPDDGFSSFDSKMSWMPSWRTLLILSFRFFVDIGLSVDHEVQGPPSSQASVCSVVDQVHRVTTLPTVETSFVAAS